MRDGRFELLDVVKLPDGRQGTIIERGDRAFPGDCAVEVTDSEGRCIEVVMVPAGRLRLPDSTPDPVGEGESTPISEGPERCEACKGAGERVRGLHPDWGPFPCPDCAGTGEAERYTIYVHESIGERRLEAYDGPPAPGDNEGIAVVPESRATDAEAERDAARAAINEALNGGGISDLPRWAVDLFEPFCERHEGGHG